MATAILVVRQLLASAIIFVSFAVAAHAAGAQVSLAPKAKPSVVFTIAKTQAIAEADQARRFGILCAADHGQRQGIDYAPKSVRRLMAYMGGKARTVCPEVFSAERISNYQGSPAHVAEVSLASANVERPLMPAPRSSWFSSPPQPRVCETPPRSRFSHAEEHLGFGCDDQLFDQSTGLDGFARLQYHISVGN
jgi:hypothetical protein